jgi:phospholipid transport system substrate-binding protein
MKAFITKSIIVLFLFASLVAESTGSVSVNTSPYTVLKSTGTNLFSRISSNQQAIKQSPDVLRDIIEEELMPSMDYHYASYRVLGKHLRKISKAQREDFVIAMRSYLVKTYAGALARYKNQQVIFEPEKPTKGKRIIGIKTQIIEQGAPTINVVFQMRKNKKTGQWKAFDLTVEGISLLSTKQAELNKRITELGIDKVTSDLLASTK